jgi:hypothetical protein
MGVTDSLKSAMSQATKKATEYAGSHKSQIGAGLDKVGEMADKATKGKYKTQIHTGRDKAKEAVNKMGGPQDTIQGEATEKPTDAGAEKTAETASDQASDQTPGDQEATK